MEALPQSPAIPDAVAKYAASQRKGETIVECWLLHSVGGLNAATIGKRVSAHPDTIRRWLRAIKALLGITQEGAEPTVDRGKPVAVALIDADTIAHERAALYDAAKEAGQADRQLRILEAESRRLGLDVQRTETVSLQVQLSAMAPDERRVELHRRLARMASRGRIDVGQLAAVASGKPGVQAHGASEGVGHPPHGVAGSRGLDPKDVHPQKITPPCSAQRALHADPIIGDANDADGAPPRDGLRPGDANDADDQRRGGNVTGGSGHNSLATSSGIAVSVTSVGSVVSVSNEEDE